MKDGKIEIELMSDLCSGSGYAFSGTIDNDVCFDDAGLPYIPARRLKGVLREDASMLETLGITQETVDNLFGRSRQADRTGLILGNAYLDRYQTLRNSIVEMREDPEIKPFLSSQRILDQFTSVRAQTRLEDGTADENTLRFIRVVRQYSIISEDEPLRFYARVSYPDEYEEALSVIVRAARNIGMNRNRGLGSVRMKLIPDKEPRHHLSVKIPAHAGQIQVFFRNTEPLMICEENNLASENYIPGKAVRGAFASAYLRDPEHSAEDQAFKDLFLNGKTCYSPLYISDGKHLFYPAPAFINKMKKSGKYVNSIRLSEADEGHDPDYDPRNGNQPKKLKGKYLNISADGAITERTAENRIIYHHSAQDPDNPILYAQKVIASGQIFAGTITFPEERRGVIEQLLNTGIFYFGKSKTAQYGKCELLKVDAVPAAEDTIHVNSGDVLLVALSSPGIFMNDRDYTVKFDEVYRLIAEDLNIQDVTDPLDSCSLKIEEGPEYPSDLPENSQLFSMLSTTTVKGFSGVWNLRRPPVPAIAAGSTFVYRFRNSADVVMKSIGTRRAEGCGLVNGYLLSELPYRLESGIRMDVKAEYQAGSGAVDYDAEEILVHILSEELYKQVLAWDLEQVDKQFGMSASTIGRITLMLKESGADFRKFGKAVDGITRRSEKNEIENVLRKLFTGKADRNFLDVRTMLGKSEEINRVWRILADAAGESRAEEIVTGWWSRLLMAILVEKKYMKKFA